MRKILLMLLFLSSVSFAEGPLFGHKGQTKLEFDNVYNDLRSSNIGVTDASDAVASRIGEYIESTTGATSVAATTVWADLDSISLTPGDWDVTAFSLLSSNGGTYTRFNMGVSTTTGDSNAGMTLGVVNRAHFDTASTATIPAAVTLTVPNARFSFAVTTTVYLKHMVEYSAGTPDCRGRISARRVR